jgi:hypothetical protein
MSAGSSVLESWLRNASASDAGSYIQCAPVQTHEANTAMLQGYFFPFRVFFLRCKSFSPRKFRCEVDKCLSGPEYSSVSVNQQTRCMVLLEIQLATRSVSRRTRGHVPVQTSVHVHNSRPCGLAWGDTVNVRPSPDKPLQAAADIGGSIRLTPKGFSRTDAATITTRRYSGNDRDHGSILGKQGTSCCVLLTSVMLSCIFNIPRL